MSIDASAVARVTGITTQFQDMRAGSVLFLPQQIAVFAQGNSDALYSDEKWLAPSAGATGARFGFGSPAHLILRELMPSNGDGVGTIPVRVYPLTAPAGAVAAQGELTVSGTATKGAAYRLRIGGVLSEAFVIPKGAVNAADVYGRISAAVRAVLEMPVNVSHSYGTPTASQGPNEGDGTIGSLSVSGTPSPGTWRLVLTNEVANGGIWSLIDPSGTTVANDLTMIVGPGATTAFSRAGLNFSVTDGAVNFASGDEFQITVPATSARFTAKWKGASGNAIKVEVLTDEYVGVVFAVTQPTGGLLNPSVTAALEKVGPVWESMAINAAPIEDTTILDQFREFGEGRWLPEVGKPIVVFTGVTHPTVELATAVSSGRRDDRVNAQLVAPGSPNLPFVVAARQLARIAKIANNDPARDYGSQRATGLIPGPDEDQWGYLQRDQAVKLGSSTIEIKDGVVAISDVVTFYRPTGEEPPAYRFVKNIVKLQTCLYNVWLAFNTEDWDGAPLIPDDQPTVSGSAKKPKTMRALAAAIVDSLGLQAIISDPARAKNGIVAQISTQNPDRLDLEIPVQVSGNTNVKDIRLKWGLYFGTAAVVG
ncbi:MAG TPA: hypothetical protein VFQ61_06705 [Polyangiaceae bacterium]|nr:hypothetical protein [Polyangiaceae bacterium]